jgi:hypothetical protein
MHGTTVKKGGKHENKKKTYSTTSLDKSRGNIATVYGINCSSSQV